MTNTNKDALNQFEVFGGLILSFGQACMNLKIIAGDEAASSLAGMEPAKWYSGAKWHELQQIVVAKYKDPGPIMEKVGVEMMNLWYNFGPGKQLINTGVGFLKFQTGSDGYKSVVKGDAKILGDFTLKTIDEKSGKALVISTSPFNRDMERGVLIGGMGLTGDLSFIEVKNDKNKDHFEIEFH